MAAAPQIAWIDVDSPTADDIFASARGLGHAWGPHECDAMDRLKRRCQRLHRAYGARGAALLQGHQVMGIVAIVLATLASFLSWLKVFANDESPALGLATGVTTALVMLAAAMREFLQLERRAAQHETASRALFALAAEIERELVLRVSYRTDFAPFRGRIFDRLAQIVRDAPPASAFLPDGLVTPLELSSRRTRLAEPEDDLWDDESVSSGGPRPPPLPR